MALSRRAGRSRFTLILLVLTSVTVLTLDSRGSGVTRDLRRGASTVFSPVRDAGDTVTEPVRDIWNGIVHYDDVRSENERLRQALDQATAQAAQGANDRTELDQLRQQLGLPQLGTIPNVTGRIVSGALTNFDHTVEIDKGSSAGIKPNMTVVAGGLVGRVVQVTGSRSVIRLATDPDFKVGVKLASSQQVGIARGQGEGSPLVIDVGIDPKTAVPDKEVVTTSGQSDSYYPPDIPVGTVVKTQLSADQLTLVLTVQPTVDLGRLTYVTVLLRVTE
jgi:rod shape-determining protein MreC